MADAFKIVGQAKPGAGNTMVKIYECPAGAEFVGQLHVANQSTSNEAFRVSLRRGDVAATDADRLAHDTVITANDFGYIPITMGEHSVDGPDALYVGSTGGAVSFTLMGDEIT